MSGRVVHRPPVDRLDLDEGTLLLYERNLIALSPIGAAIIDHAARPIGVDELGQRLAATFGEPADGSAAEATAAMLESLVDSGVLDRVGDEER